MEVLYPDERVTRRNKFETQGCQLELLFCFGCGYCVMVGEIRIQIGDDHVEKQRSTLFASVNENEIIKDDPLIKR
jgi:hypothetical protein